MSEKPGAPERISVICSVDDLFTQGWVERRHLESGERWARAGKLFGFFFLAALLTVFVPILHFVLPPLLLIIGATLAFGEFMNTGEFIGGEITCPNCKKVMIMGRESEEWPRSQRCTGCSFMLSISKAPSKILGP